ncbi:ATP synthase subunit I [Williamwhitmania taraxaci]|uniref:F1/F0 ATPase, subunit 2 n=1 Tax=Williamwhitmania taraxaci TaxID=1640674 RepID=A0A1G6S414_9BACT|nr:ATP synthase subunit I [Williamwhitmania taraxaci]SDD11441.1 F1/F0 ATPase, subunit 2 [Williamwhitmania taraxaci]
MSEYLFMILVLLVGLALGTLFFGGLWFTVKKTINAKAPAIWFISSFFLRVSIVMIGFYFVAQGSWQRLIICLVGFIVARFVVTHITKSIDLIPQKDIYHES